MPLGIQRINARRHQPNDRITFIKALPGASHDTAEDFLEHIAAICVPIMKKHSLSVTTLEEYEPNREFLGRNFNGGEIIQLVLKTRNGGWLPERFVQTVMMHELAHCVQMNHSKAFWKVNGGFKAELDELKQRGYTGEGMWSRGRQMGTGEYMKATPNAEAEIPEHLCGGTYRSSRKRKRKPELSYKERQERRIAKKFGVNGNKLGEDEEVKAFLEKGRRTDAKPRVAGSKRGRELRAAAALARFDFDKMNKAQQEVKKEEDEDDFASDDDTDPTIKSEPDDAVDLDGTKLLDGNGNSMVKVKDEEDSGNDEALKELAELRSIPSQNSHSIYQQQSRPRMEAERKEASKPLSATKQKGSSMDRQQEKPRDSADLSEVPEERPGLCNATFQNESAPTLKQRGRDTGRRVRFHDSPPFDRYMRYSSREASVTQDSRIAENTEAPVNQESPATEEISNSPERAGNSSTCPVCSFVNGLDAFTCMVCANVLFPERSASTWKCASEVCKESKYVNAADYGRCGVCGARNVG